MKQFYIKKYEPTDYKLWNDFIGQAKNATFLYHRDFMEYHKDRFVDFSLLIYFNSQLIGVLPANRVEDTVFSHQGLTYGGLVTTDKSKLKTILMAFKKVLYFLNHNAVQKLYLKAIPSIYCNKPSDELLYALFLADAKLVRRDSLAVIDLTQNITFDRSRKNGIIRGIKNNLVVKEENNFNSFWDKVLIPNLKAQHQIEPVHTVQEIEFLKTKFPENVRQFNVYNKDVIVAGATIFETDTVTHCQYLSKFENGKKLGSLDILFQHLIYQVFAHKRYFDFGISNEQNGKLLNEGLSYWKESFGARTIIQDFYEVQTADFEKLTAIFVIKN
ncbi:hypothetical protein IQ05_00171 [Flavobacterium tiangeerense]|uniref:Acetyltransferase (GNAT) family protein n=1 Tax=Flavobacterium tiangeerense TaxID=459471 RepID=A0ABY3FPM5_9FLAO|nr:GNAT family N-acetyltransferase [Flavobacterium tiangeerense]TWI03240.1 hypothetical protein IQ05_00171 [Flavobacterium tiangeerense]